MDECHGQTLERLIERARLRCDARTSTGRQRTALAAAPGYSQAELAEAIDQQCVEHLICAIQVAGWLCANHDVQSRPMVLTRVPGDVENHDCLRPDVPGRRVIDAPADCAQLD